jgi:hypothetical protein
MPTRQKQNGLLSSLSSLNGLAYKAELNVRHKNRIREEQHQQLNRGKDFSGQRRHIGGERGAAQRS